VQGIHRLIAEQHALDTRAIAGDEPLDGETDLFLGEAAHFEQPRLELFQLLLKMPSVTLHGLHYPNRPVT
jgi:hypothetical protein